MNHEKTNPSQTGLGFIKIQNNISTIFESKVNLLFDKKPATYLDPAINQPPWTEALKMLQTPFLRSIEQIDLEVDFQIVEYNFSLVAHWIYKKWCHQRHKIPYSKREVSNAESLADVVLAYLSLCIELHSFSVHAHHYPTGLIWFFNIACEHKCSMLKKLRDTENMSKRQGVREIRALVEKLRDGENPFCYDEEPHHWRLIDTAQALVKSRCAPDLITPLWRGARKHGRYQIKGLVQSLTSYSTHLDKTNCGLLRIESSKILVPQKGRQSPKVLSDFSFLVQ